MQRGSLALFVVSTIAGLAIAEGVLRSLDPFRFRSGWRDEFELEFEPGRHASVNQLGFRGRRIDYVDTDRVVVLVGDSQVECPACSGNRLPEHALEEALARRLGGSGVRVFSIGASGYGADQGLLALREYFSRGYRADLVAYWQTLGNDVWNVVFPSHSTQLGVGHLKPTFRLAAGRLIEPDREIGDIFCRFYLHCLHLQLARGGIEGSWEAELPPPVAPSPGRSNADLPVVETQEDVPHEKTHWSIWLLPESPRKRYGITLLNSLLKEMRNLAAQHAAEFIVFDVDRYTPRGLEELRTDFFRPGRKYVKFGDQLFLAGAEQEYFRVSAEVNEGLTVYYVPITARGHVVSDRDSHLNERGNADVMSKLALELSPLL